MNEYENVDENASQIRHRAKYGVSDRMRIQYLRDRKQEKTSDKQRYLRFKLINVLTDSRLLAHVIFGEEGRDWRWAER